MIKAKYQKMYTEKHKQDMDFVIIGDYYIGPFIDMDVAQEAVSAINSQQTLKSKPKPPTKVVYEKVNLSINEIAKSMIEGEDFYNHDGSVCFDWKFNGFRKNGIALTGLNGFDFYRKVEKEIDWRDEVESNLDFIDFDKGCKSIYLRTWPPIKEQQFLEMCRVTLRATGELK